MDPLETILDSIPKIAHATQYMHDLVGNIIPEGFDNLPIRVTLEGYLGGKTVTWGFLKASEWKGEKTHKFMKKAGQATKYGIPIAAAVYALIDPKGAYNFLNNEAWDCWGLTMAYIAGKNQLRNDTAFLSKK